jgi:oligopeptide/dipeptide ABC transporter ATP-binding protein
VALLKSRSWGTGPTHEGIAAYAPETKDLLRVRDLETRFFTKQGAVHAVNGVSFDLARGERMAVVGESGSGKSVMSMSLIGLASHPGRVVGGEVELNGRSLLELSPAELNRVRGKEVAMVFQDPMTSLNPVIRVEEQIIPPMLRHLGIGFDEARARALELLRQVGIPDEASRLRAYPHELSGGMRQRVLIAIALSCKPDLILADEPTTALDVTIQAQIVALLRQLSEETGTAVLFVTHDLGLVARFAQKVAVMYAGRFVEYGPIHEVFANPQHPYTRGLLSSIPSLTGPRDRRLAQIEGAPPDLRDLGTGCSYAPRCPLATAACTAERPPLTERGFNHRAACWLLEHTEDRGDPHAIRA